MQKEIESLEFVQSVNFVYRDSLKGNGRKYLLTFDDSCHGVCNSNAFVDNATAGKHRGSSTIFIKHNFFDEHKFGWDVELKKSRTLFSSNLPLPEIFCKSVRWLHNWDSDPS